MASTGSVLLLENDQAVIKDITCSLRLIGVPVMTCVSVVEAKDTIAKYRPGLIIARFKNENDNPGLNLAQELKGSDPGKNVPLYALCSVGDKADLEQYKSSFNGCFVLPVEFPAFPRAVQEVIGVPVGPKPDQSRLEQISSGTVQTSTISKSDEVDLAVRDRNFALAYAIQSKVLRELEQDGRLNRVAVEQVPGILNQVTAKVCIKYATDKIMS